MSPYGGKWPQLGYRGGVCRAFLLFLVAVTGCSCAARQPVGVEDEGPGTSCQVRIHDAATTAFAFVDVHVLPMDTEHILRHQTVLVDKGRIVALGPTATTPVPAEVRRIDGEGRYLLPGLVDMHTHVWHPNDLFVYLAHGVTAVRNMWGSPQTLRLREAIQDGQVLAPRLFVASPGLDGPPSVWPGALLPQSSEDVREAVAMLAAEGYDFTKIYSRLPASLYPTALEASEQQGIPAVGHVPRAVDLRQVLERGQASIEHLDGYASSIMEPQGAGSLPWEGTIDQAQLAEVVRETKDAGVWNCPTLAVIGRSRADLPQLREASTLRVLSPELRRWYEQPQVLPPDWNPARALANKQRVVQALAENDAGLVLGTDAGIRYVLPGAGVHEELRLFVEAGLSPYEALRAATTASSAFLQETTGATVSALRVRAPAEFIMLDQNPLDQVEYASDPAGVMVGHNWLDRATLDEALDDLADCYAERAE